MKNYLTIAEASTLIGKSKETLRRWDREGVLTAVREPVSNYRVYKKDQFEKFIDIPDYDKETIDPTNFVGPDHEYTVIELFAGAGGLGIGLEKAGVKCVALNEIDKWACQKHYVRTGQIGKYWKEILRNLISHRIKMRWIL